MNTFEQNEIDGVEAIDLKDFHLGVSSEKMSIVFGAKKRDTPIEMFTKGMAQMFDIEKYKDKPCPTCNGEKQIIRQTQNGLSYGYICPDCNI